MRREQEVPFPLTPCEGVAGNPAGGVGWCLSKHLPAGAVRRWVSPYTLCSRNVRDSGAAERDFRPVRRLLSRQPLPLFGAGPELNPRKPDTRQGQPSNLSEGGIAGPASGGRLSYGEQYRTYDQHIKRGCLGSGVKVAELFE